MIDRGFGLSGASEIIHPFASKRDLADRGVPTEAEDRATGTTQANGGGSLESSSVDGIGDLREITNTDWSLLRSAILICLGSVCVGVARRAGVFACADSARLMGIGVPEARTGLFSPPGAFGSAPPTGRGESLGFLRPAFFRGQAQKGNARTARASGLAVLSARWCAVVHNEGGSGLR